MATPSLILGNGNWAVKSDSLLGYALPQGKYTPREFTVTRATTATRTNPQGLVEVVPYNLLSWSEMFSDVSWTKFNTTITANTTIAPNGSLTADTLLETTANSEHAIFAATINSVANQTYTHSCYIKYNGRDVRLSVFNSAFTNGFQAVFNVQTGLLIQSSVSGNGVYVSSSIVSVGDGWYRCSVTGYLPSDTSIRYVIYSSNGLSFSYIGDVTKGAFIWGAQLVEGTDPLKYLPTTTRLNIPRVDYSLGTANLLLEPQRTNLVLYSEQFDNTTGWGSSSNGTGVLPVRTANTTISPSGVQNADTILFNRGAENTVNDLSILNQSINIATAGTYYFSTWIKATTISDIGKQIYLSCGTGAPRTAFTLTANWVRVETTFTLLVASNSFQIGCRGTITTPNSVSVDLWGAQVELGAYATSYIPTTTASVTRNADTITKSNVFTNGYITSAGGTWFVEFRNNLSLTRDGGYGSPYLMTSASLSNGFYFSSLQPSRLTFYKMPGFVNLFTTTTDIVKIAVKWNGTTADVFVNGVKVVAATAFTTTAMEFLDASGFGVPKNINQMQLYTTPLSDTECINMTL